MEKKRLSDKLEPYLKQLYYAGFLFIVIIVVHHYGGLYCISNPEGRVVADE